MLDLGLGGILRYRNLYHHVSGIQLIREVSNNLEIDGHPGIELQESEKSDERLAKSKLSHKLICNTLNKTVIDLTL